MPPKQLFTSPSIFFFLENSPCAKNIQVQREIDTIEKFSIAVVYIDGISTVLCARVFDGHAFLVKITPWGKLLQFSWGKLSHCNRHTWDINFLLEMLPNYYFTIQVLLRNTPYL